MLTVVLLRYFGSGVIIATAFIHLYVSPRTPVLKLEHLSLPLGSNTSTITSSWEQANNNSLDPAYISIGPYTCVGLTGAWAIYSWTPAILMASCMGVFLLDVACCEYVRIKYGYATATSVEEVIVRKKNNDDPETEDSRDVSAVSAPRTWPKREGEKGGKRCCACSDEDGITPCAQQHNPDKTVEVGATKRSDEESITMDDLRRTAFRQQFTAFFLLEAGIILHSVFIGTSCVFVFSPLFLLLSSSQSRHSILSSSLLCRDTIHTSIFSALSSFISSASSHHSPAPTSF